MTIEILDKRKVTADGESRHIEAEPEYDDFHPALGGCTPLFDTVLLRELKLPEESIIVSADAYKEPVLYAEVIAVGAEATGVVSVGDVVRILKGIGITIDFTDSEDERFFTVNVRDIICKWVL